MTDAEADAVIKTTVRDLAWPAPSPSIVFPNTTRASAKEIAEVQIIRDPTQQRTMGPPNHRSWTEGGEVLITLYVERGTGTARVLAMYEAIKAGMQGKKIDGVLFRGVSRGREEEAGAWYFLEAIVVFEYYPRR